MTREELAKRVADASLLRGQFTLRSGRTSRYYLDKYRFTTRPELLRPIAELLSQRVAEIERARTGGDAVERGVERLAGAELGGIPLVTATSLEADRPALFVRTRPKDYGTAQRIEGVMEKGDRVVLLEDVATTGGQALEATRALHDAGAEVVGVIAVIDRQEGAAPAFEQAGIPFHALFTKRDLGIDE